MFLCLVASRVVWMKCSIFEIHLNSIIKMFCIRLSSVGGGGDMFVFVIPLCVGVNRIIISNLSPPAYDIML